MNLREAAEMALDALDTFRAIGKNWEEPDEKAFQALRAALAEAGEPVGDKPYLHVYEYDTVFGLHREFYPRPYNGKMPDRAVPVYAHPHRREPLTEMKCMRAICQRASDGYCAPCHAGMYP